MAGGIQNIGLSALAAFQRAIQVTAHNIANANTPGFSRQSAVLTNLQGDLTPVGRIGGGVGLALVRRSFDQLLFNQLRETTTFVGQNQAMSELASVIDGYLSGDGFDLAAPMGDVMAQFEAVSNDPTSIAARTALLSSATTLADRFSVLDQRVSEVRNDLNGRIESYTREINSLTTRIADLNQQIADGSVGTGQSNDLLDQRDQAVLQLADLVSIQVVADERNILNVSLSNGQNLVNGTITQTLGTRGSEYDSRDLELVVTSLTGGQPIDTARIGGRLGGTFSYLADTLNPTQNELGRIALSLAININEQQNRGLDLDGNLGLNLFNVPAPELVPSSGNSNLTTDTTGYVIDDLSQVTGNDYILAYDGAAWSLTNQISGTSVPLTVSGSDLIADGLRITPDPTAAAGDSYLLRPTRRGAGQMDVAMTDPRQIAAAGALMVDSPISNLGTGSVSPVQVLDPANPALLSPATISFDSPTSFRINGGPPQTYAPGDDIDFNGWRLQINGAPSTGDSFSIASNQGSVGDGSNAQLMAAINRQGTLQGGALSTFDAHTRLVTAIGVQTNSLEAATAVQINLQQDVQARLDNVQGVNLDEEAVNLQQFQQAYAAAAEMFAVAEEMFQSLLRAVR